VRFAPVLDAWVLYPLPLRDTLLRVSQQNVSAVRWSDRILDKVSRNLRRARAAGNARAALRHRRDVTSAERRE
jgi:hypothetical protein